jgi:Ca2+-binding RTX toxin-like protein
MANYNFTNTGNIDGYVLGYRWSPYIINTNVFLATVTSSYASTSAETSNLTVTNNSHGYAVGDQVYLDFTSGNAIDSNYTITAVTYNTFSVTSPNTVTSGNVSIFPVPASQGIYARTTAAISNLTVTNNSHGYAVGDQVYLDFTSGNAIDSNYTITAVTNNTFSVTAPNTVTSGYVSILPGVISPQNAPQYLYSETDGAWIADQMAEFKADLKTLQSSLSDSTWRIIDVDKRGDVWGIKFADSDGSDANTIRFYGAVTQSNVQPAVVNGVYVPGYVNFAVVGSSFDYNIGNTDSLDGENRYLKSTGNVTFNFRQTNEPMSVHVTGFNIDPYGTSSSYKVDGALMDGAVLSSGSLPSTFSKIGRDNYDDQDELEALIDVFNGNFVFDSTKLRSEGSKGALSGFISSIETAELPFTNPYDSTKSAIISKWTLNSGSTITDSTSTGVISLSSTSSYSLTNVKVTNGVLEINPATQEFRSPSGVTSDLTITSPTTVLSNKSLESYDFTYGNDTFDITSSIGVEVYAGLGNDTVYGGAGDDTIFGGGGNDTLNGGAGNDIFKINQYSLQNFGANPYEWSLQTSNNEPLANISAKINGALTSVQHLGRTVIDGGVGLDVVEFGNPFLSSAAPNVIIQKATLLLPNAYNFSNNPIGFPINSGNGHVINAHTDNNNVTTYQAVLAPTQPTSSSPGPPNQIGFKFTGGNYSSPHIPNEAVVMSNVEFIDYNDKTIDARPLYLASEAADTLYAMSERNFLELLNLFGDKNQADPFAPLPNETYAQQTVRLNQAFPSLTNPENPFHHFSSNFTYERSANANFYVLAGGDGHDTLFGTNKEYLVNPSTGDFVIDNNNKVIDLLRSGNDVLDGNLGNDTMSGGSGIDVYYVDSASDIVIESALNNEYDFVFVAPPTTAPLTYALQSNTAVEVMVVHQLFDNEDANNLFGYTWFNPYATLPSSATAVNLTGSNYTTDLIGHNGANTITAGSLAGKLSDNPNIHGAVLVGLAGNDTLIGGEGDDAFFGGADNDTLTGGLGNDRFYMGFTTGYLEDTLASRNTYLANDPLFTSFALNTSGIISNTPNYLTGGVDTATGGKGIDTVVLDSYLPAENTGGIDSRWTLTSLQRVSENQIRIYTPFDSMTVDSSTELLEFFTKSTEDIQGRAIPFSEQLRQYILPFIPAGDERSIKNYFESLQAYKVADQSDGLSIAYAPASIYGDFVSLKSSVDNLPDQNEFDGLAGNDFILAGSEYERIFGGADNDRIYSSGSNLIRQELFGGLGDDTLSVWLAADSNAQFISGVGFNQDLTLNVPSLLLDGGAGNDTYRISTWNTQTTLPTFEISDSAGTDTIIVSLDPNSDEESWSIWDSGQLSVRRYDGAVFSNINAGVIENIAFSFDNAYFTPWKTFVLINPSLGATGTFASGKLTGAATNDALISMTGVRLNYDGGAGDDLISLNEISGGVAIGGAGNNLINVRALSASYDDNDQPLIKHTLSYSWTSAGQLSEIDLNTGFSYVVSATGTSVASDNFSGNQDFFPYVIGGAANDTIRGNFLANILDGGAGDDVIYSGLFDLDNASIRDTLIGNIGNDILIDQTNHAIMDGGAGNDTYVIESSNTGDSVHFRRIIETTSTGADTGGTDTLKLFGNADVIVRPVTYSQAGNLITIQSDLLNSELSVGALVNLDFKSGAAVDNFYTVLSKNNSSFTVASSVSATTSGTVLYANLIKESHETFYQWHDSRTLILADGNNNEVDLGARSAHENQSLYTQNQDGTFNTDFSVMALIDRNALDFAELNVYDELQPGIVSKVSFDTGTTNSTEIIFASANGPAFLNGGLGSDYIIDSLANDILLGGEGNDLLASTSGQDIVLGGNGDDQINFQSAGQLISGGLGSDSFVVGGTDFDIDQEPQTILSDFKYWENDKVALSSSWLERLMDNLNPDTIDTFSIDLDHNNAITSFYLVRNYTTGTGESLTYVEEKSYLFDLLNNNHSNDSIDLNKFENENSNRSWYNHDEFNAYTVWDQLDSALTSYLVS